MPLFSYSYHSFLIPAATPLRGVIWFEIYSVLIDIIWSKRVFIGSVRHTERMGSGFTTGKNKETLSFVNYFGMYYSV